MTRLRTAAALGALLLCSPMTARADAVLDWNAIAITTLTSQPAPGVSPFAQARFMSITQLAVFEAVNAITDQYEPYLGTVVAPAGASPSAAAIAAAYTVLRAYFPGSAATLDPAYAASLAALPAAGKSTGIATGVAAAEQMIARRVGDGSSPPAFSLPASTNPGVWQLTPSCPVTGGVNFQWQNITPFGIPSVPHSRAWVEPFRPDPPPALDSGKYAKSYNEVKRVGNVTSNSTDRPQDRADVARFYAASSPSYLFNLAARQVAVAQHRSLSHNARALALINMATNDSLVASFEAKYHYYLWRPETAIRDPRTEDINPRLESDPAFKPYILTPCFPSYPSNHASGSGGAAEMLNRIYGNGHHRIVLTNPTAADLTVRDLTFRYKKFKQITDDIDDARVYGGIHFRFDQEAGGRLGDDIAGYIYRHNLRPEKHSHHGHDDGDDENEGEHRDDD
jgi:hypothetical protein